MKKNRKCVLPKRATKSSNENNPSGSENTPGKRRCWSLQKRRKKLTLKPWSLPSSSSSLVVISSAMDWRPLGLLRFPVIAFKVQRLSIWMTLSRHYDTMPKAKLIACDPRIRIPVSQQAPYCITYIKGSVHVKRTILTGLFTWWHVCYAAMPFNILTICFYNLLGTECV